MRGDYFTNITPEISLIKKQVFETGQVIPPPTRRDDLMNSPNVSTMGSFLTIALRLAILITPRARVTVTTMGRPSGMAATARLRKIKNKEQ